MKVFGTKQKDRLLEDILNAREISVRHSVMVEALPLFREKEKQLS